jgi:hypothetical protein
MCNEHVYVEMELIKNICKVITSNFFRGLKIREIYELNIV